MRLGRRRLLQGAAVGIAALLAFPPQGGHAQDFEPFWVQSTERTELLPPNDPGAAALGVAPSGSYFLVTRPASGPLLFVWNPVLQIYCHVNAAAVTAVPPPSPEMLAQRPTNWVTPRQPTMLWTDATPQALALGLSNPGETFEIIATESPRLRVRDPLAGEIAYVDAAAVGPADAPQAPYVPGGRWRGTIEAGINLRAEPSTTSATVGVVPRRSPVTVARWVSGQEVLPDQPSWAQLADGVYIYSALLRPAAIDVAPRLPAGAPASGRWIDANLTHQVAIAYEGRTPVYQARFCSGRPSWETTTGTLRVLWRVEKETMDSSTLMGLDAARASYRVEDIKWTQYFTNDGQAIHHNYWRDPALFGIPSSHGCLGMLETHAHWLWEWATVGTPLVIHHEAAA